MFNGKIIKLAIGMMLLGVILGACAQPTPVTVIQEKTVVVKETVPPVVVKETVPPVVVKETVLAPTPVPVATKAPITLVFWNRFWAAPDNPNRTLGKIFEYQYQVFGTQNPDIKIKLEQEPSPTDTKTKIIAAAKAGQLPDVVTIDPAWLPELVDMGALQPLENLWPAEDRKDLPAAMTQIPMINGHLYSLWFMTDVRALYYRKDLLQAQGLQPPKTWDDLRKVAAALNNPAKGQWGFGFTLGNTQNTLDASVTPQFLSQGGQFVDDQGNPTVLKGKNRPIIEGIFQYYHDLMYVDKVLSPSSLEIKDTDSTIGRVCAGELAMWVGGSWQPYQIQAQWGAQLPNWDVTDLPIKAGAKPTTVGGGWNFGITTKDPERQKAAWKLVYFLSLPENQAAWGMNWLSYPTRFSATKDPWFSQDPLMKRFGDIQPTWQFYAATSPIWNAMSTELVQAFTGYMANKMDLKPALDAADKNIDAAWAQLKK